MRRPLAYLDDADFEDFQELIRSRHQGHCGTCRYFEQGEGPTWPSDESFRLFESADKEMTVEFARWSGCCHRYPPQSYSESHEAHFGFAQVQYDDWCGEHRPTGEEQGP